MAASDGFAAFARHVNPPLGRFLALSGRDYRFTRGEGTTLTTESGETFRDWIAGFGALSFGHNPPFVREVLGRQSETDLPSLFIESLNPASGALAKSSSTSSPPKISWYRVKASRALPAKAR